MPVQTPNSLQQQIHRAEICNQQIKVQIQRLLQHLCSNYQYAPALCAVRCFSDTPQDLRLVRQTIRCQEAGMIHQNFRFGAAIPKKLPQALRTAYRVDNDTDASPLQCFSSRVYCLRFIDLLDFYIAHAALRRNGFHTDRLSRSPAYQRVVLAGLNFRIACFGFPKIRIQQLCSAFSGQGG